MEICQATEVLSWAPVKVTVVALFCSASCSFSPTRARETTAIVAAHHPSGRNAPPSPAGGV